VGAVRVDAGDDDERDDRLDGAGADDLFDAAVVAADVADGEE